MFTHYSKPDGCEWRRGGLNDFVAHYNGLNGSEYTLTACLDVVRISGDSPKEPEVLLTDPTSGRTMVIERKSVVSPPDYLLQHELGHRFVNRLGEMVGASFRDAGYALTINAEEFRKLSAKQVAKAANEIGRELARMTPADLPVRGERPIRWVFGRDHLGDEDGRVGISLMEQTRWSSSFDDPKRDEALAHLPAQLQGELNAAGEKFARYSHCSKIVLLDFYGEDLDEDDVPPAFSQIVVPANLDEVWRTVREWASADDYEAGYDRLFVRIAEN
jgi:hypothetical protein